MKVLQILVIDGDEKAISEFEEALADAHICSIFHKFSSLTHLKDTRYQMYPSQFDLCLVDPVFNKKQAFDEIASLTNGLAAHTVVWSNVGTMNHVHRSFKFGAEHYIYKPSTLDIEGEAKMIEAIKEILHIEQAIEVTEPVCEELSFDPIAPEPSSPKVDDCFYDFHNKC